MYSVKYRKRVMIIPYLTIFTKEIIAPILKAIAIDWIQNDIPAKLPTTANSLMSPAPSTELMYKKNSNPIGAIPPKSEEINPYNPWKTKLCKLPIHMPIIINLLLIL